MSKQSAGILVFRRENSIIELLLVHPGGPFFASKDEGAWSIPKGEFEDGNDALAAAKREFAEELGQPIDGVFYPLTAIKQKGGKLVLAWAVEASPDVAQFRSNTFTLEWPPRSGKQQQFPEIDKAGWFGIDEARKKVNVAQSAFIEELVKMLGEKK